MDIPLPYPPNPGVQLPLDFGFKSRLTAILTVRESPEGKRLMNLLLWWADIYGVVNIQIEKEAIIIGDDAISLTDYSIDPLPDTTNKKTPTSFKYLFNTPEGKNLVSVESWMNLYKHIPGIGLEKAENFLKFLGHENASQNCVYWTNDHPEDSIRGYYHWMFHIHLSPSRHKQDTKIPSFREDIITGSLVDESEKDMDIRYFGDERVFFSLGANEKFLAYQREAIKK